MMIEVDESITAPPAAGRPPKYPFRRLLVGQSLFVPGAQAKPKSLPMSHWRLATGFKFTTRQAVENGATGLRIWRTA
jgi:hypothetical protein